MDKGRSRALVHGPGTISGTDRIDELAAHQAPKVFQLLAAAAGTATTEAAFRFAAANAFAEAAEQVRLSVVPRHEYHVARGNADSVYNRLVLEYKKPGLLRSSNASVANRKAIEQVETYILDIATREHREAQRLAGVITDGAYFIFVRRVGEGWSVDEAVPVDTGSTQRFLRLLFSLSVGAALIPENLLEDFGPRNWRAKSAVRALYRGFAASRDPLVSRLFDQWRTFFSEATDYREWADRIESKPEFRSFVSSLWTKDEIRHLDPARVFFILHTYYALLIKLVASLVAARFAGEGLSPLTELANRRAETLKPALIDLERGGLFRKYGIRNFLEGDFFGWYLSAWNPDISEAASSMVSRLAQYDSAALELAPENARDLLKKLYHSLLPKEIRHDLGEYYTPDWLAERLIRQTLGTADLGDPTKRVLDPACGSGTFLLILINFIKERSTRQGLSSNEVLRLVLRNVVGFDLNPLAVIAARTNYLIALGDLLKARGTAEIDLPVYQADSILAPSQATDLFDADTYPLKTAVGVFRIPAAFAARERMDMLANLLDEAVEGKEGEQRFLVSLTKGARLTQDEQVKAAPKLASLYRQLTELHDSGLNGVWTRIIKNAFAPVFLEPCHYIVGNPPWVNWENLPDEYRSDTKPVWEHYGLFPHRGMDTILGKGKKDISSLMTYVAADKYLRPGGRLGFVLSQALFKTSGAGQGFRRFLLPDGTPIGPIAVEDMVSLKPFEGPANRTAVAIFVKGQTVRYPVAYQLWRKRATGRGRAIGFDTPYEEVTKEKITFSAWQATPVRATDPTSSWITGPPAVLRALQSLLSPSEYKAHEGVNTGGATGVFWLEVIGRRRDGHVVVANITETAKRQVASVQTTIEPGLLFPLLRQKDISRWEATAKSSILMTQDPKTRRGIDRETLQTRFPRTWSYLKGFEKELRSRKALARYFAGRDEFWSMFDVGNYSFAPIKVVWPNMATQLSAAVIATADDKPILPQHIVSLLAVDSMDEAHYCCAVLNSSPFNLAVQSYSQRGGKSFGTPHILQYVHLPTFSPRNALHRDLSALSRHAHELVAAGRRAELPEVDNRVNLRAAELWGISGDQLERVSRALLALES